MMHTYGSITRKVTIIILTSLSVGIGAVVLYFAYGQNTTLYDSADMNLHQQADVLHQSVKNAMLPGEAPLVVSLFTDIQTTSPMYRIRLYRRSGVPAFSDNSTLETVNANLGEPRFQPKERFIEAAPLNPAADLDFATAVEQFRPVSFQRQEQTKTYLTIYRPLLNLPKCTGCHGSTHTVRGVVAIRADMTPTFRQARRNIMIAVLIFIGIVLALFAVLSSFIQRTIITPIKMIGHVSAEVTKGNFREKVAIKTRDEIGELGAKINTMVDGLYERFELSKYVSSSTLASLKHSEQGTKTEIALFFSDIRGFTSFSEQLAPEQVVQHLNTILNVQTEIIHRHGGDIDKYVGDEIVALFTGAEKERHACSAALEIQRYLRQKQEQLAGLQVGIGINTGSVILGMIGSEKRADFTVIGDHVNFASRLCNEAGGGAILISESTYRPIQPRAEVTGPDELRVKGKAQPQAVFRLIGMNDVNGMT
jgi:class 3 adenylate cyclase